MHVRARDLSLLAALILAAAAPASAAAADFFDVRSEVIRLYGASAPADLADLYERSRVEYRDTGQAYFLYRMAALAELAGMEEKRSRHLREILSESDDARFALYYTEYSRSRGSLEDAIDEIVPVLDRLTPGDRLRCLRALCLAFAWQTPPPALSSLVSGAFEGDLSVEQAVFFSKILHGWGMRDEAVRHLLAAGERARKSPRALLGVVAALRSLGAAEEARETAGDAFEAFMPPGPPEDMTAGDAWFLRRARLSRLCDIAGAGAAWDVLLGYVDCVDYESPHWRQIDRAVVFEAAGLAAEAAEAMERLPDRLEGRRALYGSAQVRAGDAYGGRQTLLGAVTAGDAGEDAYFDLMDAVMALGDAATLKSFAALYTLAFDAPQQSHLMADLMRALGEYEIADRLFAAFVEKTGLGPDTRFAWQGGRLAAIHYLDTGRLAAGRDAAFDALDRLIGEEKMRGNMKSPVPDRFVDLFARFGGLEDIVDYCRRARSKYPDAVLIDRIEQAALEKLGRWDEALALEERVAAARDPVNRDLFMASANARAGRWEEAARLYRKAIEADRNVPSAAWWELARALAEQGKWVEVEAAVSDAPFAGSTATDLRLAELCLAHGETERASRVYERLDYLPARIAPPELAPAVKFWASTGRPRRAAEALARRVALQTDLDSKKAYIREALPQDAALAAKYLEVGSHLEEGPLASDRQLLAWFYERLAGTLETALDSASALEAWRRAWVLDPADPGARRSVARFAAAWRPEEATEAAAVMLDAAGDGVVHAAAARAAFASRRRDDAREMLSRAVERPLSIDEAGMVTEVLEAHAADEALYRRLVESVRPAPWTLRARTADAAAAAGYESEAASLAREAADGTWPARAVWAARRAAGRGALEEALAALDAAPAHPAVELARVDILLGAGRPGDAARAAAGAARSFGAVEPVRRLFESEAHRLGTDYARDENGDRP